MTALSAVIGWRRAPDRARAEWIVGFFALNGFLNVLWTTLFFHFRHPDWALAEVVLLWLSIIVPMLFMAPFAKTASWLLAPYLAWVSFAGVLNWAVVSLNRPF